MARALPAVAFPHLSGAMLSGPMFFAAPADERRDQRVSFAQAPEIVEVSLHPGCDLTRQMPRPEFEPIRTDFRLVNVSDLNKPQNQNKHQESLADALRRATQLANGEGRLCDDAEDVDCWEGSKPCVGEVRGPVVLWRSKRALIYDTVADGLALYGRGRGLTYTKALDRSDAIRELAGIWDQCRHLGTVPERQ